MNLGIFLIVSALLVSASAFAWLRLFFLSGRRDNMRAKTETWFVSASALTAGATIWILLAIMSMRQVAEFSA